jgi:hypothetical protein
MVTDLEILMELHVFNTPEYENGVFGMLAVCMYVSFTIA